MIELKVVGTANTKQMEAALAASTANAKAFNEELARASATPAGFRRTAGQMAGLTRAFDSAIASSEAYRVEQVRINDVVARNTELLAKQKLGISQVFGKKSRDMMRQIYREQLAMQEMMARTVRGGVGDGRLKASLYIPKEVSNSWETLSSRVGMFSYKLASASRTLLNWGKNTQWAGRQLTAGLTYPMLAFGAAAGIMAFKVDKQFTRIAKVYNTTADQFSSSIDEQKRAQEELNKVRENGSKTALEAARLYGSSITDTLAVQADLAATGQTGMKLQLATTAVVKSAMLGEIDYQTATKATIALQQQLHASSSELADMWAYMNSVENQTSLQMKDFAEAIPIALGPIRTMGGDLHDLGTLMTGMVSQGIQVGKAANAIKALPQRLSRPSAQVQAEFAAMTGQDIMKINAGHGDNIIDLLTAIYNATQPLEQQARKKVFAGLFGSFQLSTMTAMVESMGDLANQTNQVTTAQNIGMQTAEQWGEVQEGEIKQFQKSASGKFKIALETIKASLATAGEPFLLMATKVLGAVTAIMNAFNKLPSAVKKGFMFALIIGAIVGPLIMVVGLMANLIANMGLLASWALKLVTNFNILNKAEEANNLVNELAAKGLAGRATQTALLTDRVKALTLALEEQMAAYRTPGTSQPFVPLSTVAGSLPSGGVSNNVQTQAYMQQYLNPKNNRYQYPGNTGFMSNATAEYNAQQKLAADHMKASGLLVRKEGELLAIRQKSEAAVNGTAVAMGAMGVAMAAQMVTSNSTVDSISKWVILLAIGVPAAKALAVATKAGAIWSAAQLATARGYVATQFAASAATAKIVGPAKALGAASRGAAAGFNAMMGPIGWSLVAITAIGVVAYKWHQHEEAITKEKREQANSMYEQKRLMEDQLDITEKTQKKLRISSISDVRGLPSSSALADEMKNADEFKSLLADLKDNDVSSAEKDAIAMEKYRGVLEATGGTAKKAQLYLEAMFIAAGDGALKAQSKALEYARTIGSAFTDSDMNNLWGKQLTSIFNDDDLKSIREQGANVAQELANAIVAGGHSNAQKTMDNFVKVYRDAIPDSFTALADDAKDLLAKVGVQNADQLNELMGQFVGLDSGKRGDLMKSLGLDQYGSDQLATILESLDTAGSKTQKILEYQVGVVKELADQLGIEKDIATFKELQATWEWKLATATSKNAEGLYQERIHSLETLGGLTDALGARSDISDEQKLIIANQVLENAGLGQANTLAFALWKLSHGLSGELNTAATAAKGLADAFTLTDDNAKSMMQSAMTAVQDDIADSVQGAFDDRMDAAIDGAQNRWDARIDALQDQQQKAQDRFDNRWERRKDHLSDYYDKQKDVIDKAVEAEQRAEDIRQKIFDAEEKRIQRLADMQNRNIDFNVAVRTGNLDEAARIQNDAIAAAAGAAVEDAAGQSSSASDQRINALNDQKDLLDKQEKAAEDALAHREEVEKRHFDKMQEIQMKALKDNADAAMKAYKDDWDRRKDSLSDQLTLFKSYIATNQTDLESWMKEVGLSYDSFGKDLKGKGTSWATYFRDELLKHVREAGAKIAADSMWQEYGRKEALATLRGMGFANLKQFKKFIMTGELPTNFGQSSKPTLIGVPGGGRHPSTNPAETMHSGGFVGSGINNRIGVARTHHGLHNNEMMLRAQKGEFLVNRDVASQNPDILTYFNKYGILPPGNTREYTHATTEGLGAGIGAAGLIGAMARGVGKGLVGAMAKTGMAAGQARSNANVVARGGAITPYAGTIGEPTKVGSQAIAWAADQIGAEGWYRLCQKFVRVALGAPSGFASANEAWYGANYRHSITDPKTVPPGVPVYWTDNGSGHAALSTGGGNVISTDYPNSGFVGTGTIAGITGAWHKALAGWTEDINGKRIFGLPGLSSGGYTANGGAAIVHDDELVLDKSKTQKLYGMVDSLSTNPYRPWEGLYKLGPNGIPDPSNFTGGESTGANGTKPANSKNVKIGTYNVKFSSSNTDTQADLNRLFGMSDVLSLTEFVASKRALIPWINKQGWGVSGASGANESVIAYDKAKFNASNVTQTVLNKTLGESLSGAKGKGGARSVTAASALLSGQGMKFWQIAAHTIAHIWKNPTLNRTVQQEQYGNLGKLAVNLGKSGLPVFLGGDLNNDPRNIEGSRPGGKQGMKNFAPLTAAGLSTNWIKPFMMGNLGTMGDRFIDHVMFNAMAKLISTKTVGGLHSDHRGVVSEFAIPQFAKGAYTLSDGMAMLHKKELVLSEDLSNQFKQGVQNFANGGGNVYNTNVALYGAEVTAEEVAAAVEKKLARTESRRPTSRSNR